MEQLINKYITHLQAKNYAKSTIDWQEYLLIRFIEFLDRNDIDNLSDVDDKTILLYQHHIYGRLNRKGKQYSIAMQNQHLIVVKLLYKFLLRTKDVTTDPTTEMELSRLPRRLPATILSEEEMFRLLEVPDTETVLGLRDRAMMEILYSVGIRRNELLHLNLGDICFETKNITIRQGKNSKDRIVPLGSVAEKYLKRYLLRRDELLKDKPTDALFLSFRGKRFNHQTLRLILADYGRQAGIKKRVNPHCFRHSCACHLLDNGAGIVHIQILLGHERLETTTRYLQISIQGLKKIHQQFHPREQAKNKVA